MYYENSLTKAPSRTYPLGQSSPILTLTATDFYPSDSRLITDGLPIAFHSAAHLMDSSYHNAGYQNIGGALFG